MCYNEFEIDGLKFKETCAACPEQYDVYKGGEQVGYIRLRWGYLSCESPYIGGEEVYSHSFSDDFKGVMASQERDIYLEKCAKAINEHLESLEDSD